MKSILIRNLDEKTLSRLKNRAQTNHRSLQGELHAILEKAAITVPDDAQIAWLDLKMVNTRSPEI